MSKKKVLFVLLSIVIVLSLSLSLIGCSAEKVGSDIDELLAPYQEIIDKVNSEYGTDIIIPDDEKENVYNYYKDMTLEEFEETIRKELEIVIDEYEYGETSVVS